MLLAINLSKTRYRVDLAIPRYSASSTFDIGNLSVSDVVLDLSLDRYPITLSSPLDIENKAILDNFLTVLSPYVKAQ